MAADGILTKHIADRVKASFVGKIKDEKIEACFQEESTKATLEDWISIPNENHRMLVFFEKSADKLMCALTVPDTALRSKAVYFIKSHHIKDTVSPKDLLTNVFMGEVSPQALHNLNLLAHEIYFPLLSNPANRAGWSGPTSKDMMLSFSKFLGSVTMTMGQSKGQTLLPQPPAEAFSPEIPHKERIYLLESSVTLWMEKIQAVLQLTPETISLVIPFPDPINEWEFWASRTADFDSLLEQLQSEKMRDVVVTLQEAMSAVATEFQNVVDRVVKQQEICKSNAQYLGAVKPYFKKLRVDGDFAQLADVFRPLMHSISLVWKQAPYYNTKPRLTLLLQEVCNVVVHQGQQFCAGEQLFRSIEDDNVGESLRLLQLASEVCVRLKNEFQRYQLRARQAENAAVGEGSWDISEEITFQRINQFLGRCDDIREFFRLYQEFAKLEKIYVGGTKGKVLTECVRQLHEDFKVAVAAFSSVPYDIIDISVPVFDDDYYSFRLKVKELERRLAGIIITGFDDGCTLEARFQLLDSFEGLLDQPTIRAALQQKNAAMLAAYAHEVRHLTEIFHTGRDKPHLDSNMPPVAGALQWARTLFNRLVGAERQLKKLSEASSSPAMVDACREVENMCSAIKTQLNDFESEKIAEWDQDVANTSEEKLNMPLLRRDAQTRRLSVNFDQSLVRLLREVKYSLSLNISVQERALSIYQRAELYRQQIGNLEWITSMYNEMIDTLEPVERPLVEQDIVLIDQTVERGLGQLNWVSPLVDSFIQETMDIVKGAFKNVRLMKDNLDTIKKLVSEFAKVPLVDRRSKPVFPADFEDNLRALWKVRSSILAEHQATASKLLSETQAALKVQPDDPMWKAYLEFAEGHILQGLSLAVQNSIRYLTAQLDPVNIEQNGLAALLEVRLCLVHNEICFVAESGQAAVQRTLGHEERKSDEAARQGRDVWTMVGTDWVSGFLESGIGNSMLRASGANYVEDLRQDEKTAANTAALKRLLDANQREADKLKAEYLKYEFMWKTNQVAEFKRFLHMALDQLYISSQEAANGVPKAAGAGAAPAKPAPTAPIDPEHLSPEARQERENPTELPLDKFDDKIVFYRDLLAEIQDKKSPVEIGWLKVNAQDVKVSLTTWVSKWTHMYTSYLSEWLRGKLLWLDTTMREVNQGLKQEVVPGDSEALKSVLGYIHRVKSQEKTVAKMFQPLRDTAALLKKYGRSADEVDLKMLSDAPVKWDYVLTNVYKTKETVNALQNEEVEKIKERVRKFNSNLNAFWREYRTRGPFSYDVDVMEAYDLIYEYHKKLNKMEKEAEKLEELEQVFELAITKHRMIEQTRHNNTLLKLVWDQAALVEHNFDLWKKTPWDDIDTDQLKSNCKSLMTQIKGLPKESQAWPVFAGLRDSVQNLMTVLDLVKPLHSPAMEDRHWNELKQMTGKHFEKDASFNLNSVMEVGLHNHVADVEYIVELANKESKIGSNLKKIESVWADLRLTFQPVTEEKVDANGQVHKETFNTITSTEEVLTSLEENMAALQGMQGQGKYVEYFIETVNRWKSNLGNTETVLVDWLDVQSKWMGLHPIFLGSKDIRVQLPDESSEFDIIDAQWRHLMQEAANVPNVIDCCLVEGRGKLLDQMKRSLERLEKALFQYLESKRMIFPRFYFLSNAALLDLLSHGDDPQAVQKHLGDCFDGIKDLVYQKDANGMYTKSATVMTAKEGFEEVAFDTPFTAHGDVEVWLNELVEHMRASLRLILERAKFTADHWEIEVPRHKWLSSYPAQIALTASQVMFTEEVTGTFEAFAEGNEQAMKDYAKVLASRLEQLINLVLDPKLSKSERIKVITLITVDVHNRDVVAKLIDGKVTDVGAFVWLRQMRFDWLQDKKDCVVRVADASLNYCFEYVGNTGRLVITPLTDRCYITLTQALRLIMGGAPAGPAGTGKTETVKDLGRAVGLPVYVFNCSEQMNVQSLSSIFKGLTQSGSWGCFDEFNRISVEVLSVVSTQVASILNAIRERAKDFDFLGDIIRLVPSVGVFITMNPGYAGRTELPENIKALFRSCAMVVPDLELICENMLMSEGFQSAQTLAHKFVVLYSLSSQLLSKQAHYDWGLRAVKAVLRVAGGLKRAEPAVDEKRILMRALRDFNLPKLVDEDKPIFLQLIDDLFPGLGGTKRKLDKVLKKALTTVVPKLGLQAEETFIMKCVELAELMAIRHSVFVIGPAGAGKSCIWKALNAAFNHLGPQSERRDEDEEEKDGEEKKDGDKKDRYRVAVYEVINPKAVQNKELYGYLQKTDWHDGVLSTVMRSMSRNIHPYNERHESKWCVLDGDIDPNWIESLNTVMDDNKVLTLVSNERIPLTPTMRMVFEISNLDNATPATVSRAGILYINARDVGWKPFLDSWIEMRESEQEKSSLMALFNKYCTPERMTEMRQSFKRITPLSEINMVQSLCYLLEGLIEEQKGGENRKERRPKEAADEKDAAIEKEVFEQNFVYAVVWACGGALPAEARVDFSEYIKRIPGVKFPLEKAFTVFDFYPDAATGLMTPWIKSVPKYQPAEDAYLVTKVLVPTVETTRMNRLLNLLVRRRRPVQLVGSAGTGKTVMLKQFLESLPEEHYIYATINLNNYTDAKSLQKIMEQKIDKRSGRVYGPPGTKKLIYFIDDLNMPYVDAFGTQSPSCLIRQHMDYGSWFDVTKLEKKEVHDVQYISCMNHTAGSFSIDDRLQGHFATFAIGLPTREMLVNIYNQVMGHHLERFPADVRAMQSALVEATVDTLDAMRAPDFQPNSKKFHYQWNLRELGAVFQGLCQSRAERSTPMSMITLWQHELMRVFSDRMISKEDVNAFAQAINGKDMKGRFTKEIEAYNAKQAKVEKNPASPQKAGDGNFAFGQAPAAGAPAGPKNDDDDGPPPSIFTSFHKDGDNMYQPAPDWKTLKRALMEKLHVYNESNPAMNLELYKQAMEHVARIVRIIEQPRGNALLVGVGGSGKQSLAKLASSICGFDVFQITVTGSYGMADLKLDLQQLYIKAGVKNISTTFILTDTQIVNDEWLVFINDLLSSGNIPSLFNEEELDDIFNKIRPSAKAAGANVDSREALMAFFIDTVRSNLHVVLCFSPVGETFRVRARKFPALVNTTAIDWFHPWPRDALISVAVHFLEDIELGDQNMVNSIAENMAESHLLVDRASEQYRVVERRYNYTTPKSFLELINFFKELLARKRSELDKQTERLVKGIDKLKSTGEMVAGLQETLKVKGVVLDKQKAETKELIDKIGAEKIKVEAQQKIAEGEAAKSKEIADECNRIEAECKIEVDAALPILKKAVEAVDVLSRDALTELKNFKNPPGNVLDVTNAIMILRKERGQLGWAGACKMMGTVGTFLQELKDFDATAIDEETLRKLAPILGKPYFTSDQMEKASKAAANLCEWVINIVQYKRVHMKVQPKLDDQKRAGEQLAIANAKLKKVEDQVAAMQAKLKLVTDQLQAKVEEANRMEADAAITANRLDLAQRLMSGLTDEGKRWEASVKGLEERARTLVGDVLLSAAFVSYIGAFNQKFRLELWRDRWLPDMAARNIPMTPGVDPLKILADESDFAKWKNHGLAADRMSLENGAIVTSSKRWPLMIDPQLQGIKWIRNQIKDLIVVQMSQKKFMNIIIQAVEDGNTVLIEAIGEELDASLDALLSQQVLTKGSQKFIRLGSEDGGVSYNDKFRLLLQTKLPNPHYRPEVAAQCTLLNFTSSEEGLEDQLLAQVVNREKPELEESRTALVRAINDYMVSLTDLENELLHRLANAPEDILSDSALISGLERTKLASKEIAEKVVQAREQEIHINSARNEYQLVAAEGSWLYFLMTQLQVISHMYQYSLDAFLFFFHKAMRLASPSDNTQERVENLRQSIRITIFRWVNRGMFEKHKQILTTQLTFKLMQKNALAEKLDPVHFDWLIRRPDAPPSVHLIENKLDWMPNQIWNTLQSIGVLEDFNKLCTDMLASPNRFKEWYTKSRPEDAPLPLEWRKLDEEFPFKKLMLVRAMRQDRITSAMKLYVERVLPDGKQYTECDAGKGFMNLLEFSYEDSTPVTPLFFILSPGADPINFVESLAKRLNMHGNGKYHRVALGQGQDTVAELRLANGHKEGHWVVLENIHLMPRWTSRLEKILDDYVTEGSHKDFRVFLTAEPSDTLPVGLLERSIKLTNEPPSGLKQNLKRAFASFDREEFEYRDPKMKLIMFGLCHFHSVIIERTKFGSKGWNRSYPFGTGDLLNSVTVLSNYLENQSDKVPWADLRYIFGEILYGGHITDDWDRLLCSSYLDYYLREELMDEMEMFPFNQSFPDDHFASPAVLPYEQYFNYIDEELPPDSPVAFGLHPNAEIAMKTRQGDDLFRTILELQPRTAGAGGGADNTDSQIMTQVDWMVKCVVDVNFRLEDIALQMVDESGKRGPYQNVFLQECERMNILTREIVRSLGEVKLGLEGLLQMSERMDKLKSDLFFNRVPESWTRLAYPSMRSLASWNKNLLERVAQLQNWTEDPANIPNVTTLSYMFNPQSFLTAIKQKSAQKAKLELDKLEIQTDVTRKTREQTDSAAREGAYVSGLVLDGARWNVNSGLLEESLPREMTCPLPVVNCRAVMFDKLEKGAGVYRAPVYKTTQRGPTYVFTAGLRSRAPPAKWVLAGCSVILEVEE